MISINNLLINRRYGYFLIWGHGLSCKDNILQSIRKKVFIDILRIIRYKPSDMKKFISIIYSNNYAPLHHLINKTKYLLQTPHEVLFIFFRNNSADERFFGNGSFKHTECVKIKRFKEKIRNQYNPRKNNRRTENHIIHASDNEVQVDYVLKYLGFDNGIQTLKNRPNNNLSLPSFLPNFSTFRIKEINSSQLVCNILKGNINSFKTKTVEISKSPHYRCLCGDSMLYKNYVDRFLGGPLQCDYCIDNFLKLSKKMRYLKYPYSSSYIVVEEIQTNRYLIIDGLHRASILLFNHINKFPVLIK